MSPSPEHERTQTLADSPWFWFLLFGLMALAALTVVGPRYSSRQTRLQQNYEGRRDAWQRRVSKEPTPAPLAEPASGIP